MKKYKKGSELKDVPMGKEKSLGKLPTAVRNKMGFKKGGGESMLNKMMKMGGTIDMSEEFVEKMRKGGSVKSYKYGGSMKPMKSTKSYKMGGWTSSKKK